MDFNFDIKGILENNKQLIGNETFSSITGYIQGALGNSGVELKSQVVPVAASEKKEEISNFSGLPSNYLVIGGVVIAAFLLLKMKKGRV